MISEIRFEKFDKTDDWIMVWDALKTIIYVREGRNVETGWEVILKKRKPNSKRLFNRDFIKRLIIIIKSLISSIKERDNT